MPSPSVFHRDSTFGQKWRQRLARRLDQHAVPESAMVMITAVIVGVGVGAGAVIFRWLIEQVRLVAYEGSGRLIAPISPLHLVIIPFVGALIFGPLIYRFAREAKGHGVPEIMEAIALRGGRIRPQVAIVKSLASSLCIGTGGSAGSEGPIAQIGAALGSTVGQVLKLSDERVKNLVACGAAGGIAAAFNAPIAGSLFALEVILGQFHAGYFGAVVISAVVANVIAHIYEGNSFAFSVPAYSLVSPWELIFYTILGGLAAIISVFFSRSLYLFEDVWETIRLPEFLKPALGALLLGLVGIFSYQTDGFPRVFGVGYETMSQAFVGQLTLSMAIALLFLKMLATNLTLGSGGSGGVFAPSLFMGAMLGSAFGQLANQLFPALTAPSGAYALVGMAAFFGGAAHAPVTSILIIFEMTGDYRIILPLMLATVMSTLVSRMISRNSIYTLKLSRRGIRLDQGQDIDVLQGVTVGEAMARELKAIPADMPLPELSDHFARTHHHGLPVVDATGALFGMVSIQDLERALAAGPITGKQVRDIATTEGLLVAYPHEPMGEALRRLGVRDLSLLPVVEKEGSRRLMGVIRRRNIIQAYNSALIKRAEQQHQTEVMRLGKLDDAGFVHIDIPDRSPVVGQRVSEIKLPEACLIVSVRRGRKLRVAHGYTVLHKNDRVTVFADDNQHIPHIRHQLTGQAAADSPPEQLQRARHQEIVVPDGAMCAGKMIRELDLPAECILVSIKRQNEVIIPHGDTLIKPGDVIEVFGIVADLAKVENYLAI